MLPAAPAADQLRPQFVLRIGSAAAPAAVLLCCRPRAAQILPQPRCGCVVTAAMPQLAPRSLCGGSASTAAPAAELFRQQLLL
eukprot:15482023-Alexandrium_andersonii.AAC.1